MKKIKRLSQSRLPQRDLRRSLLPDLEPGHLPLVRTVDCLAGTGECRTDGEASCVWGCASGLIVRGCLYVHVAAKYLLVRILRHLRHLQANTPTHWGIWLGCTIGLLAIVFILAEAIPISTYILALVGALCYSPLSFSLPGWLWLYSHDHYRRGNVFNKSVYGLHILLVVLGVFMMVGGTYGVIVQIIEAYRDRSIDSVFTCADNSGTV